MNIPIGGMVSIAMRHGFDEGIEISERLFLLTRLDADNAEMVEMTGRIPGKRFRVTWEELPLTWEEIK